MTRGSAFRAWGLVAGTVVLFAAAGTAGAQDTVFHNQRHAAADPTPDRSTARIAIDYDRDRHWDAFEQVSRADLEQILRNRRQRGVRRRPSPDERAGHRERDRVSGRVSDRLTVRIGGREQVLARVETDEGRRAKVWLGPKQRIEELDIRDGDRVSVEGEQVLINEMPILLARRISVGGRSIRNDLPPGGDLRALRGELVGQSQRRFRNHDGRFVVAEIRTEQGDVERVILGKQERVARLELQRGGTLTVLGKSGRLNGRPVLVAHRVATKREQVRVSGTHDRPFRSPAARDRR